MEVDDSISYHDAATAEIRGHTRLACWFESLAVASRPLQRGLAETDFEFPFDFARIISGL